MSQMSGILSRCSQRPTGTNLLAAFSRPWHTCRPQTLSFVISKCSKRDITKRRLYHVTCVDININSHTKCSHVFRREKTLEFSWTQIENFKRKLF